MLSLQVLEIREVSVERRRKPPGEPLNKEWEELFIERLKHKKRRK